MDEFVEAQVEQVPAEQVGPGVAVHRLWRSGPERWARRALAVDFSAGSAWPGVDVHEPGPEEVYVVSGTFFGLTGPHSVHEAGAFIHCGTGTSHSPSSPTGGRLFVYYPEG